MPDRGGCGHIFAAKAVSLPARGQIGAESIPGRPKKNRNPVETSAEIGGICASLRRILRDFEKAAQNPSQTRITLAQTGTNAGRFRRRFAQARKPRRGGHLFQENFEKETHCFALPIDELGAAFFGDPSVTASEHSDPSSGQRPSAMDRAAFLARFGGVFEHSPWIAERALAKGLGPDADTAEGLHARLVAEFRAASEDERLGVLRAHPDLAGKLAAAKRLTAESAGEQASAGLDALTDEERARFTALNEAYTSRFGFPFILAVKGRSKAEILENFEARIANDREAEFATACAQVERIALLRLKDLVPG